MIPIVDMVVGILRRRGRCHVCLCVRADRLVGDAAVMAGDVEAEPLLNRLRESITKVRLSFSQSFKYRISSFIENIQSIYSKTQE